MGRRGADDAEPRPSVNAEGGWAPSAGNTTRCPPTVEAVRKWVGTELRGGTTEVAAPLAKVGPGPDSRERLEWIRGAGGGSLDRDPPSLKENRVGFTNLQHVESRIRALYK